MRFRKDDRRQHAQYNDSRQAYANPLHLHMWSKRHYRERTHRASAKVRYIDPPACRAAHVIRQKLRHPPGCRVAVHHHREFANQKQAGGYT